MTVDRRTAIGALVLLAVLDVLVVGLPASACSCAGPPSPEAAVAGSEVAFVGTVVEREPDGHVYRIAVEEVAKGEALDPVVTVVGADAAGGCGPDYGEVGGRVAVLGDRDGGGVRGHPCSYRRAADLEGMRAQPPPADGRVAAVATLAYRWANLLALSEDGAVVSSTHVPDAHGAVAHCEGTSDVLVNTGNGIDDEVVAVDLATMEPTGERFPVGAGSYAARLACATVDGNRTAVVTDPDGHVRAATATTVRDIHVPAGPVAVPARSGRVFVLPARSGEPLRVLAAGTLEVEEEVDLGGLVVVDGSLDPAEETLALLVSTAGEFGYQVSSTGVRFLDVGGRRAAPAGGFGLAEQPGSANRISFVGRRVVVDRELYDSRRLDVHERDGTLVGAHEVPWGFRVAAVGGAALRVTDTGLDRVGSDGASVRRLDAGTSFVGYSVAAVIDGPDAIDPVSPPEHLLGPDAGPEEAVATRPVPPSSDGRGGSWWLLVASAAAVAVAVAAAAGWLTRARRGSRSPGAPGPRAGPSA